ITPLHPHHALTLLDAALRGEHPVTVPARIDTAGLRATGDPEKVPPLMRSLVRIPVRREPARRDGPRPWMRKLTEAAGPDRPRIALDLVRGTVAEVLRLPSGQAVPAERGLLDLGFDSLTAVELRNRLAEETGLRLPTTLLFDHPTATALAGHLLGEAAARLPGGTSAALAALDELAEALPGTLTPKDRDLFTTRLSALLTLVSAPPDDTVTTAVEEATDDELFRLIDTQLGSE
ncbi:beta-ketoacyl reductase, partial [Sphaerisporangium rubeum]